MKINCHYVSTKHYDRTNIYQWIWRFESYTYIKGWRIRICGISFNIREKDATKKLIALHFKQKAEREQHFKEFGTLKEYVRMHNK